MKLSTFEIVQNQKMKKNEDLKGFVLHVSMFVYKAATKSAAKATL